MTTTILSRLAMVTAALATALPAAGQNWTNYGGNAQRNGLTGVVGPNAADLLWTNNDDFSLISWMPFIWEGQVFVVREAGFPQDGGPANDTILAYDLQTGVEAWRLTLPFNGDTSQQWIAWIGGVNDGRVYCSRSSNDKFQPITALDTTDGSLLWTSEDATEAWAHDGIVFAPDGDLIVGDFGYVYRINAEDGATVWITPRSCPVSGNCGGAVAVGNDALYIDESEAGGNVLTKLDLATGAVLYSSPVMPGFTDQNSPFVSPDGETIYFARTQNNDAVDFLYAFEDTGAEFVELWSRPVRWTTSHEHGIAADGSIYTFLENNEFVRLDPSTGDVLNSAGFLEPIGTSNLSPKTAVDSQGKVYVSNGWASNPASDGRLWAFNADLSDNLFTLNLDRQNAGGPALGGDGVLVVCDRQAVYAYKSEIDCPEDLSGDGFVGQEDLGILLASYDSDAGGDIDGDGDTDQADLGALLAVYGQDCP